MNWRRRHRRGGRMDVVLLLVVELGNQIAVGHHGGKRGSLGQHHLRRSRIDSSITAVVDRLH